MERVRLSRIRVHPQAASILRWIGTKQIQGDFSNLSAEIVDKIQSVVPIHVVRDGKKQGDVLCFSGLQMLSILRRAGLKEAQIVLHDGLSEKDIAELAWLYEVGRHLISPQRNEILASAHSLLELAPKVQRRSLTSGPPSSSATKLTEILMNETRAAVRNQLPKIGVEDAPTELERMIGGSHDG